MGLPEEDRGPAWLRDWGRNTGYTESNPMTGWVDGRALQVDVQDLQAFANALQTEFEQDFLPHLDEVYRLMEKTPASPDERFIELTESMTHHRDVLVQTSTVLEAHKQAVTAFFTAAREIGNAYRGADELTAAKVSDVEANLVSTSATTPVTPEQAESTTPNEAPETTPTEPTTTGS
ncbi:hypothetical protein [Allorhizocola rhizosphaerae]|uniref:hypothetical protein n=1 Tax=Allorhizocola rhizosphaerae TaxID=1872709 RepID=UPI0013C3405F|nr:hypothetical protein [Allorhizocola rhizosphaerae]